MSSNKEKEGYTPKEILKQVKLITDSLGFDSAEVKSKGQGATTILWKEDGHSITFHDNIDNPSIYLDASSEDTEKFFNAMKDIVQEYNGKVSRNKDSYEFDLTI
jgi:hypothetical protein